MDHQYPDQVDIVVINYNTLEFLRGCLESIKLYTDYPYQVMVVDNASTDGSVEFLLGYPDIKVILNKENRGYGRACNQGITAGNGKYILFLNSDTRVTPGWLKPLVECARSDSNIAVVGNKQVNKDHKIVGAGVVGTYGKPVQRGWGIPDGPGVYDQQTDCLAVCGACFLIKRELLPVLGMLDERYFFYFEETDYCYNAKAKGYRVVYCPQSTIYHYFEGSPCQREDRIKHFITSDRLFRAKWKHLLQNS